MEDADFIFESMYADYSDSFGSSHASSVHTPAELDIPQYPIRVYSSDADILSAYYVYIHPYFPIMPPPESHQVIDKPDIGVQHGPNTILTSRSAPNFEPVSPISLAIAATLTLIAHPSDPDPLGIESIRLRRSQAQALAQTAFESIEIESELLDSVLDPGAALSNETSIPSRTPFHPRVPIENETIIALLLLSTYEYAQRGNIAKMRNRAGQALNAAMDLGLHTQGNEDGIYAESNRRTWWMTYILVCQTSILSSTTPPFLLYDPRFSTPGPTICADMESWQVFLQAQQAITSATMFAIDLAAALKTKTNPVALWDRMRELDAIFDPLIAQADTWTLDPNLAVSLDQSEMKVAQALRGMARIKLNSSRIKIYRYCAFTDVPVFSRKNCDLDGVSPVSSSKTSSLLPSFVTLPISSHSAAKLCLKSAFTIASSFKTLPYPEPQFHSLHSIPNPNTNLPRTVPVFICCAMQASYALIMLSYRTRSMGLAGDGMEKGGPAMKLLERLREALGWILDALRNFAGAFEAVSGMRDQIQMAMVDMTDEDNGIF